MEIIYVADDGTKFDSESACREYELFLEYPALANFVVYDEDGKEFNDPWSEEAYNFGVIYDVPSEETVEGLRAFAEHSGFSAYADIVEAGKYIFDGKKEFTFIKVEV